MAVAGRCRAPLYQFNEEGMREIAYEETEHYRITRDFLNHRECMLRELMS